MIRSFSGSVGALLAIMFWAPQVGAEPASGLEEFQLAQGIVPTCPAGFHFSKGKCLPGAAPQVAPRAAPRSPRQIQRQLPPQVAPRQLPQAIAPPRVVAPPRAAPLQQAERPPMSPKVQAYMSKWADFLIASGIDLAMSSSFSVLSCPGCVPFLINCKSNVNSPEGLRGLRLRVSGDGVKFANKYGAMPVLMPGGEIQQALRENRIDCIVAGGVVPR